MVVLASIANGNKTCPSLFTHVILKNFLARGFQGFVHQSSLRVEQPSVLSKFFFQNYHILLRLGVRAESLRARSQNMPNLSLLGPPCSLRKTRKKFK